MGQNTAQSASASPLLAIPLEALDQRETRYLALTLAERAKTVLADAEPALTGAEGLLKTLAKEPGAEEAFSRIRRNPAIVGKMRPSDAKNLLMDGGHFIEGTLHKLAAWRKTMERLAEGEGVVSVQKKEYIANDAPLALAIAGIANIGSYLSITQLAVAELAKKDSAGASRYQAMIAEMRRAATVLNDCECAASLHKQVQ